MLGYGLRKCERETLARVWLAYFGLELGEHYAIVLEATEIEDET